MNKVSVDVEPSHAKLTKAKYWMPWSRLFALNEKIIMD